MPKKEYRTSTHQIIKNLTSFLCLLFCMNLAHADMVDFFNGVKLGKQLPEHQFSFVGTVPDMKGQVVLLDFWATWCEPCRKSIPELNAIHEKYKGKGLVVIGLSQEPMATILPYLEKLPMQYSPAADIDQKVHKALGIKALPYAILIDRSSKIIWRGQPSSITDKVLEMALKKVED
jgi:thiol-disulfide isomerase/thioredoxin